jgi:hypothetical protein
MIPLLSFLLVSRLRYPFIAFLFIFCFPVVLFLFLLFPSKYPAFFSGHSE